MNRVLFRPGRSGPLGGVFWAFQEAPEIEAAARPRNSLHTCPRGRPGKSMKDGGRERLFQADPGRGQIRALGLGVRVSGARAAGRSGGSQRHREARDRGASPKGRAAPGWGRRARGGGGVGVSAGPGEPAARPSHPAPRGQPLRGAARPTAPTYRRRRGDPGRASAPPPPLQHGRPLRTGSALRFRFRDLARPGDL